MIPRYRHRLVQQGAPGRPLRHHKPIPHLLQILPARPWTHSGTSHHFLLSAGNPNYGATMPPRGNMINGAIRSAMARYGAIRLGGRLKSGHLWTVQNRPFRRAVETREFYRTGSSVRKSVCTFVRQLRGPHLSTWAWWSSRSRSAATAAVSPKSFPQSSTGRLEVISVEARS